MWLLPTASGLIMVKVMFDIQFELCRKKMRGPLPNWGAKVVMFFKIGAQEDSCAPQLQYAKLGPSQRSASSCDHPFRAA